jgi:hypothetical protein
LRQPKPSASAGSSATSSGVTDMAEELKACLRCGCADITDADYGQEYWCQCTVCGLRTKSFSSRIADDMGWNTRAHAPSQGGEAVRLELVENLKYGGMHIRKWENLAGLGAGTHKLYTHPADQAAEGVVVSRELLLEAIAVLMLYTRGGASREGVLINDIRALLASLK